MIKKIDPEKFKNFIEKEQNYSIYCGSRPSLDEFMKNVEDNDVKVTQQQAKLLCDYFEIDSSLFDLSNSFYIELLETKPDLIEAIGDLFTLATTPEC